MHKNGVSRSAQTNNSDRPDPEVVPAPEGKPKRRRFTIRFKLKVLEETDRLAEGEIGAYLRRHGLYWSYLSDWRRMRTQGSLAEKARPGRPQVSTDPVQRELAATRKELDAVKEQLRQANLVLDVQKKVLLLCDEKFQRPSTSS